MEMKVAATCMHLSQPAVSQSPASKSAFGSSIISPKRTRNEAAVVCHFAHRLDRSSLFGKKSSALLRTVSCEIPKSRRRTVRRATSADMDNFSDDEFAESLRELAYRGFLELEAEALEAREAKNNQDECSRESENTTFIQSNLQPPPSMIIRPEPPYVSMDLPLSLRIINKRNQWKEDLREVGESAYSSVNKAFSSMVFIIRELHSYTLQMREFLFLEDFQGILDRVQKEMHDSFVWLFQQIFSHTPTLMMYVMILMANFTVHSMSNNVAFAAQPMHYSTTTETVSSIENQEQNPLLDSTQIKSSPASFSSGNGGGGKVKPIGSGTDGGDGNFSGVSSIHHGIIPDELSQVSSFGNPSTNQEEESATTQQVPEVQDETKLWNLIVDQASQMQAVLMDESLDHETMQQFVSPISAEIEPEDMENYSRIELMYQEAISNEPNNPLLLSNYAQFLFLVVHDHDRAEEYFKRASQAKPADAEALSKYASFLWIAKKDAEAAEETYLEAIEADPGNVYHAANYAHFLWNSGAEDTCFPLST